MEKEKHFYMYPQDPDPSGMGEPHSSASTHVLGTISLSCSAEINGWPEKSAWQISNINREASGYDLVQLNIGEQDLLIERLLTALLSGISTLCRCRDVFSTWCGYHNITVWRLSDISH